MDILNGAIESLISSSNKEDWTPVALSVADATVTISKDQVRRHVYQPTAVPSLSTQFCLCVIKLCCLYTTHLGLSSTHIYVPPG